RAAARAHRTPAQRERSHCPAARRSDPWFLRHAPGAAERRVRLMPTVGLLTVSDGRESVHRDVESFAADVQAGIAGALEHAGHVVVQAQEIVWTNELAVREARRIADARPALTIISIPVWAFPHFTMRAAREIPGPLLLF